MDWYNLSGALKDFLKASIWKTILAFMYDKRVTLEKSHALEEIEKLELFIGQAENFSLK